MTDLSAGIRAAIDGADNPVAAAQALGRWARTNPPEYETERDAIRWSAEQALAPFFKNGDRAAAKPVAWAVLDAAWTLRPVPAGAEPQPASLAGLVMLDTVKRERVRWLWPGRIPLGKFTILDGDPGLGKSSLALDVAARISRGDAMPDGSRPDLDEIAGTVLLTAEDGLGDTIGPRLDAMGSNCALIGALQFVVRGDGEAFPTVRDIGPIEAAIERVGARLLIVDPLTAYLGGDVNSHRDQDVRGALSGLVELADRRGVAVVAIRHLNKQSGGSPLYRGGGSIGLIAAARSGLLVAVDPDDETGARRILAVTKYNLAAPVPALAYRVEPTDGALRIAWDGETAHRAADLLAVRSDEDRSALDEAKEFLLSELTNGRVPARQIKRASEAAGLAWRTTRRAKEVLKIEVSREGFGPGSTVLWSLPRIDGQSPWPPMEDGELATYANDAELRGDSGDGASIGGQAGTMATYEDLAAQLEADIGTTEGS